ncbi:MAG: S1C family serine protease [Galactobacter sp.]
MSQQQPEQGRSENPTERLEPTVYPTATYESAEQSPPLPSQGNAPAAAPEQQQLNPVYFTPPTQGGYGGAGGYGYGGYGGNGGFGGGNGGWGQPPVYGFNGGSDGYGGQHAAARKKGNGLLWGLGAGALALSLIVGGMGGWAIGNANNTPQAQQGQTQNGLGQQGQNGQNNQGQNGQLPNNGGNGSDGGSDNGSGDPGIENLPYNEYGNGQGNNAWGGNGSTLTQGTKLGQGQAGFVLINTAVSGGRGAGTGLILKSNGTVLTNYHVVEGSETVKVTDSTTNKTYDADVVGRSKSKDVAVLKLKGASGLKTVKIAEGSVKNGDAVSAIGNASGQGFLSQLDGKVIATQQSITTRSEDGTAGERLSNLIATDADVVPGYSGGAFVNSAGEVVGVTTAASSGNTSASVDGYAIPIADAIDIAKKIESGEGGDGIQIGRAAALGISVLAADSGDVGGGYGVTVNGLVDGGSAGKLGIKEGDTIIGLDGDNVKSFNALKEILAKHQPGDTVSLTWLDSSGEETTKDITLGESSVN